MAEHRNTYIVRLEIDFDLCTISASLTLERSNYLVESAVDCNLKELMLSLGSMSGNLLAGITLAGRGTPTAGVGVGFREGKTVCLVYSM